MSSQIQMTAKWANGKATWRTQEIGPRHDPYGREIVELTIGHRKFVLLSCGLCGAALYRDSLDGQLLASLPLVNLDGVTPEAFDNAVTTYTGYDMDFWLFKLRDIIEKHRPHFEDFPIYA